MLKDSAPQRSPLGRDRLRRYGTAIVLALAAFLIRFLLRPWIGDNAPYVTFFLASAASAGLGGFGPGLLSATVGALLASYLLPTGGLLHIIDPTDRSSLFRFFVASTFVSYICHLLIQSKERARSAEQRIRTSESIYRAIGESIPFGTWTCDAEGRNTYASDSFLQLVGLTQQECSSLGWAKVLHPDDAERTIAAWRECVKTGQVWDIEHRFLGTDGKYHPVLARGVPIRDESGRIVSWAGINLDISRLKETEAELQSQTRELGRSNRELEQFAFVASHDLREPLRTVNIYTELLLKNLGDRPREELEEFASFIHRGVEKMEKLIGDLLSFSRVIHAEAQRRRVDTELAFEEALNNCRKMIDNSGAEIQRGALPAVLAEEGHVTQVFQNLLSNAVKYRQPDVTPRITISAEQRDHTATFLVEDNGIGFDQIYAETIFGLFKRLHGNQHEGNGLGLAICQRIVERYGGQMWAKSEAGRGSKFYFTFPLS